MIDNDDDNEIAPLSPTRPSSSRYHRLGTTPVNTSGGSKRRRLNLLIIIPQVLCVLLCCALLASLAPGGGVMIGMSVYLRKRDYDRFYVPAKSGYGYVNPNAISISQTTKCTVINPLTKCHLRSEVNMTQGRDESGGESTVCQAQVSYVNGGVKHMLLTNTTISASSKYAKYKQRETVTCYYDRYRWDLVSYYPYINMNTHNVVYYRLLMAFGVICTIFGGVCLLCACCAVQEVVRRDYFNREYQSKLELL